VTIRVGFVGAGLIANFHAMLLSASHEEHVLTGVYDPDATRAHSFSEAWNIPVRPDADAVLDGCDAVYVCTWTSAHGPVVEAAAARGLAVFCEKPLAVDLPGARSMTETVESAEVVNQVGLVLRYSPAFNLARHLLAAPDAGPVMSVVFRDDQYLPVGGSYSSSWRGDRTKAGSGTLLEHSIHDLDMLETTVGPITSVSARSANHHGMEDIEDTVAATVTFGGGGLGTLVSVWHDVVERESQRHVEIFARDLYVEIAGDWDGPVTWQPRGRARQSLAGEDLRAETKRRGINRGNPDSAFLRAVQAGTAASPSFRDALRAHVLTDAFYRSAAAGGGPVDIPAGTG
jgi:predicted dehydrogenase